MDIRSADRQRRSNCVDVVLLGKEHRLLEQPALSAARSMKSRGWMVGFTAAVRTDADGPNASSVGIFIAAGSHIDLQ